MKYLHTRDKINEGARLNDTRDKVYLHWRNSEIDDEILLSNTSVEAIKTSGYTIAYGLKLGDIRRVGTVENKATLDQLKNFKIVGSEKALSEFMSRSLKSLIGYGTKINYIVPLGSTKPLSKSLAEVAAEQLKAKIVPLEKKEFKTIADAFNWDYISGSFTPGILRMLKTIVKGEIESAPPEIMDALTLTKTDTEFRDIISSPDIVWKTDNYTIQTSGKAYRGSRRLFKTKYKIPETNDEYTDIDFKEALINCILHRHRMIIVDDNLRSGEDMRAIFKAIDHLIDNMYTNKLIKHASNYKNMIMAYVLIYAKESEGKFADQKDVDQYLKQD